MRQLRLRLRLLQTMSRQQKLLRLRLRQLLRLMMHH